MLNLLSKFLHFLGSLLVAHVALVSIPTPTPEIVLGSATPTPVVVSVTPVPKIPTVDELVQEFEELKQVVAAYTPEPTMAPIVIYVPVPQPTINPTPMPDVIIPNQNLSIGRFHQKLVRDSDFGYTFKPVNPSQLDTLVFKLDGVVLQPNAVHPNKEWYTWNKTGLEPGTYSVEIHATYINGDSGSIQGTITLPSEDQNNYYGDVTGMETF